MSEVLKPDLCVIGAGSAGLSVAAIRASVMLMERARMDGGCLNGSGTRAKASIVSSEALVHPDTMRIRAGGPRTRCMGQEPAAVVRPKGAP